MKKLILLMLLISIFVVPTVMAADDTSYLKATLLNQDPDPAEPGDYLELRWKVEKFGSTTISDINFELDVDYPFTFDSSDVSVKSIGDWKGYSDEDEFYTLYYKVLVDENALEDSYDVNLKITSDQFELSKDFAVRVGEKEKVSFALGQLVTSPLKIYGGSDENKLDLTLENIGDLDAEVVTVDLVLPEGFSPSYGYSTRANLGTISGGGNKVATLYVDVDEDITEGIFDGELVVQYSDSDSDSVYKKVSIPLSVPVSGKPKFVIENVSFSSKDISAGQTVDMSVVVRNVGTKEAESVSLRAFKESSQPFSFEEKSDFIGRLAPGDSGTAILSFTVDDVASAKEYLLDLEARGIFNQEVIVDDGVAVIDVTNKSGSERGLLNTKVSLVLALILLLIVGFIAYKVGRSKR